MRRAAIWSFSFAFMMSMIGSTTSAEVTISAAVAPPPLPAYEQPAAPGDGYIWTPGYWAFSDGGYYWVPGTWVLAPQVGYLWTPPWWGWNSGAYAFHEGYWGPQVGFYGGISYGFGYFGNGYAGGRWNDGRFYYNHSVTNVNVTSVHNVYEEPVADRNSNHVSYNGGNGGVMSRPTRQQEAIGREQRMPPVAAQTQHADAARGNPQMRATANQGKPPDAATASPTHARDLTPPKRSPPTVTGNTKLNQNSQQQQAKLAAEQDKEREALTVQQNKEDRQMAQQKAAAEQQRKVEQSHAQQTHEMQTRHESQQTHLEKHAGAAAPHGGGGHRK